MFTMNFANVVWPKIPIGRKEVSNRHPIYIQSYHDLKHLHTKPKLEMNGTMFVQYYIANKYYDCQTVIDIDSVVLHDDIRYIGIENDLQRIDYYLVDLDHCGQWIVKHDNKWIGMTRNGIKIDSINGWTKSNFRGFKNEILLKPDKYIKLMKYIDNLDYMSNWSVYKFVKDAVVIDDDYEPIRFDSLHNDIALIKPLFQNLDQYIKSNYYY